jgi:hypothetical protein
VSKWRVVAESISALSQKHHNHSAKKDAKKEEGGGTSGTAAPSSGKCLYRKMGEKTSSTVLLIVEPHPHRIPRLR